MLTAFSALVLALAGAPQDSAHLVVVATADVRGQVIGWDYVADAPAGGGVARVATILDSLRARYPGQVIAVDAGGALQGSPFTTYFNRIAPRDPHPAIEAMGLAGYDVGTLAGQDAGLGGTGVRRALAGAAFPFVSANVFATDRDTLLYPPFVVLQRGGVRVAVTAFTTTGGPAWPGVRVVPAGGVAAATLEAARRQADVVIALAHGGMEWGAEGRALRAALARRAVRPDLLVAGSTASGEGTGVRDSVSERLPVVQPGSEAAEVGVVHLWFVREGGTWQRRRVEVERIPTGRAVPAERVLSRLAAEHKAVRAWARARVGWTVGAFPAAGARAGGNLLVDLLGRIQRDRAGVELAAVSVANLSAGFRRGEIQRADLLALHPLDDTLTAVRISGAELKAYLEHAARYYRVDALGRVGINDSIPGIDFDVVSGAEYEINLHAPVGNRVRALAVHGHPVQPADSFTLAVGSRRRAGAGGYTMLATAPVVYDRGESVQDVLAEELQRRGSLDPANYTENDWRLVPAAAAVAVRSLFGLPDAPPVRAAPARDSTLVRVLVVGDLRGRFGAVPRLKTVMDSLAAECRCAVVRLGTGDATPRGTVATTAAAVASVKLLGSAGLAASVLGEQELGWPVDTLRRRMAVSGYPWLAANIFDSATGRRPDWSEPYRLATVGDRRVAVIGYVTASAGKSVSAERMRGLRVTEGVWPLKAGLDEVGAARPDLTVLLVHADPDELDRVAGALPRGSVDLVVAGHRADAATTRVQGVLVMQAGADGTALAVADLVRTAAGGREVRSQIVRVAPETRADPALAPQAERFQRQFDSVVTSTVATMKLPIDRSDRRLGQLVAEARRNALRADVGLVAADELYAGLPAGPVAYRELVAVQPQGRALALVTTTGAQLRRVFEQVVGGAQPSVHVAGVWVRYDPTRSPGRRVRDVRLPDGRALDERREYRIAVDETVLRAAGLSTLDGARAEASDLLDVDALALYLRRLSQPVEVSDRPGLLSIGP